MSEAGKGDTPRPRVIPDEEWASRWNAIFGKDRYDYVPTTEEQLDGDVAKQNTD
jgi:hypothetical protein